MRQEEGGDGSPETQEQFGVFPCPGSHRELVVIAPQSIFISSLCIIALKKKGAGNVNYASCLAGMINYRVWEMQKYPGRKSFQPPGQQWGRIPELISCPPKQSMSHSPGAHWSWNSDSESPQVLHHLLSHSFPGQAIPLSHFYVVVHGLKMRGRACNKKNKNGRGLTQTKSFFSLTLKYLQSLNWTLVYKFDD